MAKNDEELVLGCAVISVLAFTVVISIIALAVAILN